MCGGGGGAAIVPCVHIVKCYRSSGEEAVAVLIRHCRHVARAEVSVSVLLVLCVSSSQ